MLDVAVLIADCGISVFVSFCVFAGGCSGCGQMYLLSLYVATMATIEKIMVRETVAECEEMNAIMSDVLVSFVVDSIIEFQTMVVACIVCVVLCLCWFWSIDP